MNRRSGIKNLPAALMALLLAAAVLAGCASPALPGQGHGAEQVYDAEGAQAPDLTDDEEILAEDPGQNRDGEIYPWMDSSLRQVMEYVDEPDARDMCVLEAPEGEGIYLAEIDMDMLRAYRSREVMGSRYRRPDRYGLLSQP